MKTQVFQQKNSTINSLFGCSDTIKFCQEFSMKSGSVCDIIFILFSKFEKKKKRYKVGKKKKGWLG